MTRNVAVVPHTHWDREWYESFQTFRLKLVDLLDGLLPLLEADTTTESPSRVINIGSIDGITVPVLETYAYSASKAAVHHLTRVLARKLAPRHITVNAIAPGPFQSRMMRATLERGV